MGDSNQTTALLHSIHSVSHAMWVPVTMYMACPYVADGGYGLQGSCQNILRLAQDRNQWCALVNVVMNL